MRRTRRVCSTIGIGIGVALVAMGTACGMAHRSDAGPGSTGPTSITAGSPGSVPVAGHAGVPDCPAVDVSGVARAAVPGTVFPEELLQADVRAIRSYGEQHVDEFVRVVVDSSDPATPRMVATFTGHAEGHRAALVPLLAHAEQLDVREECSPMPRLERIRQEIEVLNEQDPRKPIHGFGINPVERKVTLQIDAKAEDLAAEVWATYGDAVKIMLGLFPYPPGAPVWEGQAMPNCPLDISKTILSVPVAAVPGVQLTTVLDQSTVARGSDLSGHVVVRNTGDREVSVYAPTAPTLIVDGDHRLVGPGGSVMDDLMDHSVRIAPGAESRITVSGPTATCVPGTGYLLAPGRYRVVVPLTIYPTGEITASERNRPVTMSPEVPLTIT